MHDSIHEDEGTIRIPLAGNPTTNVYLTRKQGEQIRAFIERKIRFPWVAYLNSVGITPSNASAYLSGSKKISYQMLQKLLSGCPLESECRVEFIIYQPHGEHAQNVDCTNLEDLLFFGPQDDATTIALSEEED